MNNMFQIYKVAFIEANELLWEGNIVYQRCTKIIATKIDEGWRT